MKRTRSTKSLTLLFSPYTRCSLIGSRCRHRCRCLTLFSWWLLQLFWSQATTEAWVSTSGAVGRQSQQQQQQPPARSVATLLSKQSPRFSQPNALDRIVFAPLSMASRSSTATPPHLDSNDPWTILGLEPSPSLEKKDIKRAYKRLALKYHPDVVTGSGSNNNNNKEAKKAASDIFAKINWAYETLMGKNGAATNGAYASSGAGASSSSSSSSTGWTPPHRRRSSTSAGASSSSSSTTENMNWRDFIPNSYYDYVDAEDAQYDAGGDSFGAIFSDWWAGAARSGRGAAGAGARLVTDFIEFLENNVDGYRPFNRNNGYDNGNDDDDAQQLRLLLQTGSVQDIGDEMDDTELVLQQLKSKLRNVQDEFLQVKADLKLTAGSSNYLEKMELDERAEELQARQKVVEGYIKKAQKRLLSLQTRYKQLIVNGDNDWRAAGGVGANKRGGGYGYDDGESSSTYSASSSSSSSTGSPTRPHHDKPEDAWKDESFGSFGRGRGSSRRRQRQPQEETSSQQSKSATASSSSSPQPPPSSSSPSTAGTSASRAYSSTGSSRPSSSEPFVPPHRRGPSSTSSLNDQRRLRELKVDDEFEKLKKELGL